MIDLFKKFFKHAVGTKLLDLDYIKTTVKESEAIVNTRALTYVTNEIDSIPLRPIDFLRPYAKLSGTQPPDTEWTPVQNTRDSLLDQWRLTTTILDHFWGRWTKEYLTAL
ncbi:hypothetical protein Aduo_005586 [Ancylostoma duodenale]